MHKKNLLAYGALILAYVIFGFSFLFTKKVLNNNIEMFQLLGIRFLIAVLVMTLLVVTRLVKINLTKSKIKSILVLSIFEPVVYFLCETEGIRLTSASETGVMIALIPIVVPIFSIFLLKERLKLRQWIAVAIAFAGAVMIVCAKGFAGGSYLLGYLFLLGAVVSASLYTPISRKISAQCSPFEITFVIMWVGAIFFNALGLGMAGAHGTIGTYFSAVFNWEVMTGLLYLGVVSSIVAFFCINYGLSKIHSGIGASFSNLAAVVSVVAGVLFNGEQFMLLQIAGGVLILAGIWGITKNNAANALAETQNF